MWTSQLQLVGRWSHSLGPAAWQENAGVHVREQARRHMCSFLGSCLASKDAVPFRPPAQAAAVLGAGASTLLAARAGLTYRDVLSGSFVGASVNINEIRAAYEVGTFHKI